MMVFDPNLSKNARNDVSEVSVPKTFGIKNRYLIVKDLWPGPFCDIKLAEDTQEKKLVTLKIFNKGHL